MIEYRILTNQRQYKIQRKGSGLQISHYRKFDWYSLKFKLKGYFTIINIDDWEDMRWCDMSLCYDSTDIVLINDLGITKQYLKSLISELDFEETKNDWTEVRNVQFR